MRQIMDHLRALQRLQLNAGPLTKVAEAEILQRRGQVPATILAHFDRLIVRGKKGVALVRNGVCSECHLRITSGTLQSLTHTSEVHICDNCGRYLFLEDLPATAANASPAKPVTAKPVTAKPVAAKPVAAKPVAAKPVAAKPRRKAVSHAA
jgi:hypothetical protein